MDKEQARFILHSFRPGGEDVNDSNFAEALALAAANRELGEWLAQERALDAAFAQALSSVELPEGLREDILGCLTGERHDFPDADGSHDAQLIGALASVQVPSALRQQILTAMDRSAPSQVEPLRQKAKPFWKSLSMPLAAAAGVALAFILTHNSKPRQLAKNDRLPPEVVQAGFIQTYESPQFDLEVKRDDQKSLIENLKSRSLPCPCCLPPGLKAAGKGIGCRELVINGKHGSLICFKKEGVGIVHLVIFRREDVAADFPTLEEPVFSTKDQWAIAQWENTENVFILIGEMDPEKLASLF